MGHLGKLQDFLSIKKDALHLVKFFHRSLVVQKKLILTWSLGKSGLIFNSFVYMYVVLFTRKQLMEAKNRITVQKFSNLSASFYFGSDAWFMFGNKVKQFP